MGAMTSSPMALLAGPHGLASLLAQDDGGGQLLLGEDFLPWIVLAFGAAMVAGNVLALVRPPAQRAEGAAVDASSKPPVVRAVVMIVIGAVAAIWGIASLVA